MADPLTLKFFFFEEIKIGKVLFYKKFFNNSLLIMENKYLAKEELSYIRKVITESRQAFVEDGKPYIVWGIVVAIGMTLTYISVLTQTEFYVGYYWMSLSVLGIGSIFYYRKQKEEKERVRSFVDRIQGAIWGACGSSIGLSVMLIMY